MSADSPRRMTNRVPGITVRPQSISDKTVIESVVDFIQDVAYSSQPDDKEKIHWVRFEQTDVNDMNSNPTCHPSTGNSPPLLLILGYTNGVQIWIIPGSGEAQEIISLRQGPVRHIRLLPRPLQVFEHSDEFTNKRPLMVVCDASSAGSPYCSVKFVSLKTGDEVHNIPYTHSVTDIQCNDRVLVVAFESKIVIYDACRFRERFWIAGCYPAVGSNPNPISLGSRWLAYADKVLVAMHQSGGGMSGEGSQSYTATIISAAKSITKSLTTIGETLANSVTGSNRLYTPAGGGGSGVGVKKSLGNTPDSSACRPGIVTVVDVQAVTDTQLMVQEDNESVGLVAHFTAHVGQPVSALAFDPSGAMILTADQLGHNFHLFRIMAHPLSCALGAVHHLYTLHRGDTTAQVQGISFSIDSRWVTVTTLRGTTHVFPITSYGGPVNYRTHTSMRVVNRASRFHRSAGLEDIELQQKSGSSGGRASPVYGTGSPCNSPSPGRHANDALRNLVQPSSSVTNNMNNPRLPPYPHPTLVYPLGQIRQNLSIPGISSTSGSSTGANLRGSTSSGGYAGGQGGPGGVAAVSESVCVAACFAPSRGWVAGNSPNPCKEKPDEINRCVDSLYVVSWTGTLTEYIITPHAKPGVDKVTDDSPLEATVAPRAQWTLARSLGAAEVKLPLLNSNPLIQAADIVRINNNTGLLLGCGTSQGIQQDYSTTRDRSLSNSSSSSTEGSAADDQWLLQVEISTHTEPHRRLWMGPQFSFKTFQGGGGGGAGGGGSNRGSGGGNTTVLSCTSPVVLSADSCEQTTDLLIGDELLDLQSLKISDLSSSPMPMPGAGARTRRTSSSSSEICGSLPYTAVIETMESGSYNQTSHGGAGLETSYARPYDIYGPIAIESADDILRENLADAMADCSSKDARSGANASPSTSSESSGHSGGGAVYQLSRGGRSSARSSPLNNIDHMLVFPDEIVHDFN